MAARASREPAFAPQTSAEPPLARTRPQPILTSVDFPAPLGPSSPTSSPSPTSTSTPARARTLPYCFVSPRAEKAALLTAPSILATIAAHTELGGREESANGSAVGTGEAV